MILGLSEYPRIPRILVLRVMELSPSQDDLGIVSVSQNSQDIQVSEVELCPSRDYPGIV